MRDIIAPLTAAGIIFGGGVFLYLTIGLQSERVDTVHVLVGGFMGAAVQFLFGDAAQKRVGDAQPSITTTSGPPATTTVTPPQEPI